jgi:hypothetical protein
MNLALWVAAGLPAAVALSGGATKMFVARAKLAAAPGGGGPQTPAWASSRPLVAWSS